MSNNNKSKISDSEDGSEGSDSEDSNAPP